MRSAPHLCLARFPPFLFDAASLQASRGYTSDSYPAIRSIFEPSRGAFVDSSHRDGYERRALEACSSGNAAALGILLDGGLNPNAQNAYGCTVSLENRLRPCAKLRTRVFWSFCWSPVADERACLGEAWGIRHLYASWRGFNQSNPLAE